MVIMQLHNKDKMFNVHHVQLLTILLLAIIQHALSCKAGFSPVNGNCQACPSNSVSCTGVYIN